MIKPNELAIDPNSSMEEVSEVWDRVDNLRSQVMFFLEKGLNQHKINDTSINAKNQDWETLSQSIDSYMQKLEPGEKLQTVDANQYLTRFNESLEFLSAVLKRIQSVLEKVLKNQ